MPSVEFHHGGGPSQPPGPLAAAYAAKPAPSTTSAIRVVRRTEGVYARDSTGAGRGYALLIRWVRSAAWGLTRAAALRPRSARP